MAVTVRSMWNGKALHIFEARATVFERCTGFLAPGKSYPLECHPPDEDELRAMHSAWDSLMGPADMAASCALAIHRFEEDYL